jgi:hypothetical protein
MSQNDFESASEDRAIQEQFRSRALKSLSILQKTMYQRFGRWPSFLNPDPEEARQ